MFANLLLLNFFSVLFLFLIGLPISFSEDDRKLRVTTSISGFKDAFKQVDLSCNSQNISVCRDFQCSAFSNITTKISWFYKPYQSSFVEITKNATFRSDLRFSSNITLKDKDIGHLRCVAINKLGYVNNTVQVTPIDRLDQFFLTLTSQHFDYQFDVYAVYMTWYVVVEGHPKPKFGLIANNNTLKCENQNECNKFCCKIYQANNTTVVKLTIQNTSNTDLPFSFRLVSTNDYENATFPLNFFIPFKENFYFDVTKVEKDYAVLTGSVYCITPCKLSWTYLNNSLETPFKQHLIGKNVHKFPMLYSTQVEVFPYMEDGVLDCIIETAIHKTFFRPIIETINDKMVLYQQDDILVCKTSVYYYGTEIVWSVGKLNNNITNKVLGRYLTLKSTQHIFIMYSTLKIPLQTTHDVFFCKAYFENGTLDYRSIEIPSTGNTTFKSKNFNEYTEATTWMYYTISVVVIVFVSVLFFVIIKIVAYRKKLETLKSIGLADFEKGGLKHLNSNLTIDDQVDLLPYDKKYEFPLEKLKLGEQIGSGAFGVVRKAEAKNILKNEPVTTVAVKMVNKDFGDVKNLASELKIMIHLGKHINIVNLLGACTKQIAKRELLVIVEYCRFGNLREYLLTHKHTFINQINSETDRIDFTIGKEVLGPSYVQFFNVKSSTSKNTQNVCGKSHELEELQSSKILFSNQYIDSNAPVCTRDLLLWSFQVACGMEYLSSRKIIHGDLAARNILLTDANVVKICDFGLSKNLYQEAIYQKTGDDLLPVKWLAIEAITDKIFSIQSDVWSFGIVMWELFSLARTPYFGMEFGKSFCDKLLDGYRMEAPQFANKEIYDIMLHCWKGEPMKRPSFSYLVNKLSSVLDPNITQYYIDMNAGYIKMNSQRFTGENFDYLSIISAPEFQKFSTSYKYVNVATSSNENQTY